MRPMRRRAMDPRPPDRALLFASVFGPLADAAINVDMIIQNLSDDGRSTDITFTVPQAELTRAEDVIRKVQDRIGCQEVRTDLNVVKVSIIGIGMRSHAGVAKTMFQTLAEKGINILAITTSEIKVSVLISSEYTELAVRALHTAYELDAG